MDLEKEWPAHVAQAEIQCREMGLEGMEALVFMQSQGTNFLLYRLLEEIQGLRMDLAQANEPDPDAEPDPFQTLNGPSKDQNPLRYGVKGEYGE